MSVDAGRARGDSKAWILVGLTGSTVGRLSLRSGRLTFFARGRGALSTSHCRKLGGACGISDLADRLEAEDEVRLFDEPVDGLTFVFPWYYLGGGMKIRSGSAGYRLSFLRPGNTAQEYGTTGDSISEGRSAGRRWRNLLASVSESQGR